MAPIPLDGAIVRFLVRILQRFEATISDPSTLLASLAGAGLDDAAIAQYQTFLAARAAEVGKLSDELPALLTELESSDPNLLALIAPAKDLWSLVSALVADAPPVPALPNSDVLGQLLTAAVERALRDGSTALWAALASTGFVGPGTSILSAIDQAKDGLAPYVWRQSAAR